MEPCSKRIREVGSSSTEDRLSALPDVLLHTILSSLKARQLVQTSVLSRRWRSLWRSVPCLHIDQGEFKSNPGRMSRREIQKFEDFGDFLLLRHDVPDLDSFCLHLTEDFLVNIDFARWLRRALKCSLKALRIHCFRSRQVQIPLDLGSSSHCLKRLHLSNVSLDKKKFEETINCVCVVLEELELKDCEVYVDSITSSSLRNLIVDDGFIHGHGMIIRTPRLASLDLILGMFNSPILLEEVSSLVKASICFKLHPDAIFHFDLLGLLSNLHNVTSLKLSGLFRMVMPDAEPVEFPTLKNLRSLLLDQCDLSDNFQLLCHFLQSSPNLEKLTVRFCKLPEGSIGEEEMAKLKKLRSTEIIYKDGDDIRELVCFLLHISDHVSKNTITLTKV